MQTDVAGWNGEKERASEETLRQAKDDAMACAVQYSTWVCASGLSDMAQ